MEFEFLSIILLFIAGAVAGICNAIAGGGTFFLFPVFMSLGIPPVVANASTAVSVWPGHALAVLGYRKEIGTLNGNLKVSILIYFMGGTFGAYLLIVSGNQVFVKIIPFLLIFATLLFAFGKKISELFKLNQRIGSYEKPKLYTRVCEFIFAVYGGYFGAGLGIMLMAGLQMIGVTDTQKNNALKNLFAMIITSVAVLVFVLSGLLVWKYTLFAFFGAVLGGIFGSRIARWLPSIWLRRVVILAGFLLSTHYFYKYYG